MHQIKKIWRIPSKSEKDKHHSLKEYRDGRLECDCTAFEMHHNCRHVRIFKWWTKEVAGNPEECFYTHDRRHLEEHHILRSADRDKSITIWLTHWVHVIATRDKKFERHLINLILKKDMLENKKIVLHAKVKNVIIKNVSGDKEAKIVFRIDHDFNQANELGGIRGEHLIMISRDRFVLYGIYENYQRKSPVKNPYGELALEIAPAEIVGLSEFLNHEWDKEDVIISYEPA